MTRHPSVDPGRQAERTLLAWRRTALLVLGCSLLAARGVGPISVLSATSAAIGVLMFAYMVRTSARHYPLNRMAVDDSSPRSSAGIGRVGRALLSISIAASFIGALGAAVLALP